MRWLLIQAARSILRCRPSAAEALWTSALRIAARRGKHVAVVALARRLAGILYALLRDGTVYAPRRPAAPLDPVAALHARGTRGTDHHHEWGIQQSNFNDYPVARITEAPYQTNVHIVETSAPPAGVGEPSVPRSGPREGARWSPRSGRVSLAEWPYA